MNPKIIITIILTFIFTLLGSAIYRNIVKSNNKRRAEYAELIQLRQDVEVLKNDTADARRLLDRLDAKYHWSSDYSFNSFNSFAR